MQQPGNTNLALALASGQTRNFTVSAKFDWLKNGLFADPNSDLSALFQSAVVDRQLTGDFPDTIDITEGYVAAEMTITLEGFLPSDGVTPIWQAFSPYGGAYGTTGAINVPVTLDLIVLTALVPGGIAVRQFTGYTSDSLPDRSTGAVTVTCYDLASQLTQEQTLQTWAADAYTRVTLANSYADAWDSGSTLLSWVIEHVLTKGNVWQGPNWNAWAVCAWTLNGSVLPSIGSIGIEDPFIGDQGQSATSTNWTFGYGAYTIPQYTPAGQPSTVWGAGKWGNCCFVGASKLPTWPGGRGVTYIAGNAHAQSGFSPSASYGSANSNLIGLSVWVDIDPTQTGTTQMTVFLEDAQFNYQGSNQYPAYGLLTINHATGAVSLTVKNNGWGKTWTWNAGTNLTAGWHMVYANIQFTSTAVNANLYDTGTLTASGNGGLASTLGAPVYSFPPSSGNLCQIHCSGPAQYAQIWFQPNTSLGSIVQPPMTQPNVGCTIDRSLTRLTWMPDINGTQIWDILKAAAVGELGAIQIDEQGIVHFSNRATIQALKVSSASVRTLTQDEFYNVQPESVLASVANQITWSVETKLAASFTSAYTTSSSAQYLVPANTTQTWPITLDGVQSIRLGDISWHPEAQGIGNASNPLEPGGAGPGGTFTCNDWMQIYGPDYWYDGFTAYAPGSSTPGSCPTPGSGINAIPEINTIGDHKDSRSMNLVLINANTSGGALEFAVDDSTPFLHVGGTTVIDQGATTGASSDSTSQTTFGVRSQALPGGDWLQDAVYTPTIANSLLADVKQPKPVFQTVDIVGDPRLQLEDVLDLSDPFGLGANMYASVVGINRKIDSSSNGVRDTLTLRSI
jgi:hypothetical protein